MLKILQARLQQYMNQELLYVQAGFRKDRGTRDQIANIRWITVKASDYVDHNKLWKILQEMGIPDHLTCHLTCMQAKKQQLEPDKEQWTGSKLE